jgi:molybdopterin-guanine dinucleotide biosynthesis protein A
MEDRDVDAGVIGAIVNTWLGTNSDVLVVLAIDLPKVRPEFLARLAGIARETQRSVVPLHENRFEPLVAAWHRSASPEIAAALGEGRSLQDVCANLRRQGRLQAYLPDVQEVDQLVNLNTPEDLVHLE